jgi:D-sedoheptulose 7-phosphate isomerase
MRSFISEAFGNAQKALDVFISDEKIFLKIEQIAESIAKTFESGNKVIICGNGGSNADAIHFAEELTGRFRKNRKALPAISLSDSSHITCVGNDFGFEYIFAKGVEAYGKEDDFFIGISTSGNSGNIVKAIEQASKQKLTTLALLGKAGGKIKEKCDYELIIPGKTTDRIQEIHMMILHIVIEIIERKMFPENYIE